MKARTFTGALALAICLVTAAAAIADGVMIVEPPMPRPIVPPPHPRPEPVPEPLPVKYHRVKVEIDGNIATTTIDQVFKNDHAVDLEGTYIFPLPEEAAITEFAMFADGKRMTGEVLDKDKARKIYEDIVRRMRDPGLLEYMGRNMFRARVYPIPKNGEKRIELVYKETLHYDAGTYRYIYPLNTERFSPKPLEEVSISVRARSRIPIKAMYSPSHDVDVTVEKNEARCGYEAKNIKPDKDFILYYTVSEKDIGLSLLTHRKPGEDGYFMLLVSPGDIEGRAIDKDIVFALDTSGSMSGEKMKQARDALRFCLNSLGKGDRFNLVNFATSVTPWKDELVTADADNVRNALGFVDKLAARGGTNIDEALVAAASQFRDAGRPRMLVFLTDGQPTVGITEIKHILENLAAANKAGARLFVFGVGNDVNTHLLDKIAEAHRGVPEYVRPQEDIEVKVSSFYRKVSEPILADTKLDMPGVRTSDSYPTALPDIFRGTQLLLFGRYQGDGATRIVLSGKVSGQGKEFVHEGTFSREEGGNEFIPRIWATRKIGYLMNEIRLNGEKKELVDEIIRLSKEHGIMTPYTSFLILEKDEDFKRWGIPEAEAPQVRSAGTRYESRMRASAGADSVEGAMDIGAMKSSKTVSRPHASLPAARTVKHIGDKTFYLQQDGSWVDAKSDKRLRVKKIAYLSDDYFELLRQEPRLGKYFAVGERVTVVYKNTCYQVR